MNRRAWALRIARYSETFDKLNWIAKWRAMVDARAAEVPMLKDRYALYEHLNKRLGHHPITYLEFGVASGKSMRAWIGQNRHPEFRFFGFDTFEGLPEKWNATFPKGSFSQSGLPPEIHDTRLSVLPRFVSGDAQAVPGETQQSRAASGDLHGC